MKHTGRERENNKNNRGTLTGMFITASKSNNAFLPKCDLKAEGFRPSTYEETILILICMLLTKGHFNLSLRSARLVVHNHSHWL